jgi:fibronectin-binding autotransporter adhesin
MSSGKINFTHTGSLTIGSAITSDDGAGGGSTSTGGITMSGSGTLTLTGTNTYTGVTSCNAGTVQVSSNTGLGNTNNTVTIAGGILELLSGFTTSARAITLGTGGGTVDTDSGVTATFSGAIGGSTALTKT